MLSHQPEVALMLHRDRVERLTADAQRPLRRQRPSSLDEPSRAAHERQRHRIRAGA
jgi:hypothetical protein